MNRANFLAGERPVEPMVLSTVRSNMRLSETGDPTDHRFVSSRKTHDSKVSWPTWTGWSWRGLAGTRTSDVRRQRRPETRQPRCDHCCSPADDQTYSQRTLTAWLVTFMKTSRRKRHRRGLNRKLTTDQSSLTTSRIAWGEDFSRQHSFYCRASAHVQ